MNSLTFKKKWTKNTYIILTGLILLLTYVVFTMQAEENDDPGMMQFISGYLTGQPAILPYIMGAPYTFLISRLYMITTRVPWYALAFVLINTGAVLVICDKFMKYRCTKKNYICFLCIYFGLFLYQLTNLQFTMVAGLAGLAAIMLVYDACKDDALKRKVLDGVLAAVFAFFCYNIRYQCGYAALAVMLYIVVAKGILFKEWNKKQILCLLTCVGVMGISAIINTAYVNNTEWHTYADLNAERSYFMDVKRLPYEGNEEVYNAVGWDEDIYDLTSHWCFMSDTSNRENYAAINEAAAAEQAPDTSLIQIAQAIKYNIQGFVTALSWQTAILIGWGLWGLIELAYTIQKKDKETVRKFLFALGFYAITLAFIAYLMVFGRFNSRSTIMLMSCCLVPGFCALSTSLEQVSRRKRGISAVLICGLALLTLSGIGKQWRRQVCSYETWDDLYSYVLQHKDCVYVGDVSMTAPNNLFRTFSLEERPTNYFFWGGWLAGSPLDKIHQETNGLEHLTLEDMLDENKFFVGDKANIELLLSYYNNRYDQVEAEIYHEADTYIVYGFRSVDDQ